MLTDIFGREVKKGDIIALTSSSRSSFQTYTKAKLGIVCNILPKRQWKKGSWNYNRVFNRLYNSTQIGQTMGGLPFNYTSTVKKVPTANDVDYYEVCEKITYIPFEVSGALAGNPNKLTKDGRPILRPHSTNCFLLVDYDTLSEDWKDSYNKLKQLYKI